MTDKIDMSLDDIIKKNKPARGGGRGGASGRSRGGGAAGRGSRGGAPRRGGRGGAAVGGARRSAGGAGGRAASRPYTRGNADGSWKHDLFDGPRRGGVATSSGPAKLIVSNLEFGVSDSDIQELFSEFGHLKQAAVHYDRSGRSLGTADVVFDRKADAIKAMKQYNGVPLDGRAMSIQLVGSSAEVSNGSPRRSMGGAPTRRIRGTDRRRSGGGAGGRVEKPKRGAGRGGAGKAAGGRGAKRGGRGGAKKTPTPTAEDLDKELDSYLKAR
ncbi:hypothetical protein TCAL_11634 [Tigriopus californicus]|uniref:RRM domain-containing protein n=2 Tax=Tigriopus californicus TaxID=6832 RepID=A0A553PSC6_TIGCA|nr:THO complex subunit 4-like isoform X2 [Tigriopus californicus]TRY80584.1 hypothetical protein TCAL_11634 [Tigriopus californicus]